MRKIRRVAWYEFQRNVFRKSFIFLVLSVPFFILVSLGMGFLMESLEDNALPVGYVDHAGVIDSDSADPGLQNQYDDPVAFIAYSSEEEAGAALRDGAIQVYFVLPADYWETRRVEEYILEEPGQNAISQFFDFLQFHLVASQPAEIAFRAAAGTAVTVRSIDGLRRVPPGGPTFGLLAPMFLAMAFLAMILMSAGFTMSSVADEKENRTIEVLVARISTNYLIAGKILGVIGIGLTLLFAWALVIVLGIGAARALGLGFFQDLSLDWRGILATLAIGIPTYALAVALMTAIGAMVTSTQEGQSISSVFVILHVLPLYISVAFIRDPHSAWTIILSVLPFTSLMTVGLRNLFGLVPGWQVLVSVMVQTLCTIGAVWLAGRSLRLGMLRYGQRLSWRRLIRPAN